MSDTCVSVIVPAYNATATLERAVGSVSGCPLGGELEVIVVDDGSTDGTVDVARRLAAADERVRVLQHAGSANRGTSASRNLALRAARGQLVAFLDADDWYLPNRFARCIETLRTRPDVDGTIESASVELDSPEERRWWGAGNVVGLAARSDADLIDSLCFGQSFPISGLTIRRDVFGRSGVFNESLARSEDVELWIRVACVARLQVLEGDPVAVYRRHPGNRSRAARRDEMLPLLREARAWARTARVPEDTRRRLEQAAFQYAIDLVDTERRQGQRTAAATTLLRLAQHHPHALARKSFWANCANLLRSTP